MVEQEMKQDLGRAKNAVQEFLRSKLLVPKIYLDADWNGVPMDVLAIDRAGVGDVHAVKLVAVTTDRQEDRPFVVTKATILANDESALLKALPQVASWFRDQPMQFRYVALASFSPGLDRFEPTPGLVRRMLADDGVGRIGILLVDLSSEEPRVQAVLKPERFRSSKEIIDLADRFVAENTANWEIRE